MRKLLEYLLLQLLISFVQVLPTSWLKPL